jgi:adenosylmethionine-8-amino-7-oxononanoate aminotransferase
MEPGWLTAGRPHVWLPYTPMARPMAALPVERTEGSRIFLADGRVLIDGVASWWTACHGYNHPHIAAAVGAQLERMPHVMFGGLAHAPAYRLARRLAGLLPGLPHVFFSDSGSVAVEVAMKMAAQYWLNRGVRGRTRFLSFTGGYHGDTLAAMSVCDPEEGMHAQFAGLFPAQIVTGLPVDAASAAALEGLVARHADELAGVVVEPLVQGAGGMLFHPAGTLRQLRRICDVFGLPLIFDEVFTGFGRTGTLFAAERAGVTPDIMTLSKALTGGTMGLGATLAAPWIYAAFDSEEPAKALMHGPTFMANPLACAAGCASLDLFERHDRLGQVAAIEAALRAGLEVCRGMPGVADVRVLGAIGVVELERIDDLPGLKRRFVEAGVWVRPFRTIVYLTPAFTIGGEELGALIAGVVRVIDGEGKASGSAPRGNRV